MPTLTFIPTRVPRLYDPSLAGFKAPQSYEGAKVRIKVSVPEGTLDYWSLLDKARVAAESKYKGAQIYAIPEFAKQPTTELDADGALNDAELVKHYAESTIQENLKKEKGKIVSYILHKLQQVHDIAHGHGNKIEFIRVQAKNWLSYKEVDFKFRPGVLLVSGRNKDWNGGSNGAGKSNFIQLVRTALYGSTTKGQDHDALIHDSQSDELARVSVVWKVNGGTYKAYRSRTPNTCRLFAGDNEISSGNKPNSKQEGNTERFIEQSVGMTKQMFDHSILIDQKLISTTATFLSGTDKQKKELLDEFMGTERFIAAGKLVREDRKCIQFEVDSYETSIEIAKATEKTVTETIAQVSADNKTAKWQAELKEVESKLVKQNGLDWLQMQKTIDSLQNECDKLAKQRADFDQDANKCLMQVGHIEKQIEDLKSLEAACPTCYQPVDETVRKRVLEELEKQLRKEKKGYSALLAYVSEYSQKLHKREHVLSEKESEYTVLSKERDRLIGRKKDLQTMIAEAPSTKLLKKFERKLVRAKQRQKVYESGRIAAQHRHARLVYAEKALSREGIVNYLYAQLCTRLNKAAEHYSELLCDGVISLRFIPYTTRKNGDVVNEFDVQIANSQGGHSRKDQSRGEEQIACLICILTLREVGPDCNLLLLDEPAEGLEPANAARLAEGIERLTARFPVIILATHNEHLRSRFASKNGIIIEKVNKISRIVEV